MEHHDIREALEEKKVVVEENRSIEQEGHWDLYAEDMTQYVEKLARYVNPDATQIPERIAKWKSMHETPAFVIDIAGMADGKGIGADLTLNVALDDPEGRAARADQARTYIQADITSTAGQHLVLNAIDAAPSKPLVIFFMPGAAIAPGVYNEAVALRLATFFKQLYLRLDESGEIYTALHLWDTSYAHAFKAYLTSEGIPFQSEHQGFRITKQPQ